MSDSKKVLLIAPYFVPRRRVGSLRPFKFAIHLTSLGYQPIVLTIGHKPDQLTTIEKKLLESIEVLSIDSPFDRTSGPNKIKKTDKKGKKRIDDVISSWIDRNCPIDTWIILFILRWRWIYRVVKHTKPDLIMATGDPWSGLWLGEKLSKKLNVPFVADFRDPWTLGTIRLRERSSFSAGMDRLYEKRVVQQADVLIFTSNQTHKIYTEKYQVPPSKTATIYNSFEPELMSKSSDFSISPKWEPSKLNILFLGRFRRLSSVSAVLDLLKQLQNGAPEDIDLIRIHSFGNPDIGEQKRIEEAGFDSNFMFHEPFKPEESLQVMKSADLLLLSTSKERSNIIPAKLWDYLFSDVPILSIVPNPEVGEIVEKTNAGIHFSPENRVEMTDFIIRAIQTKRSGVDLPMQGRKEVKVIQEFTSRSATVKLAAIFDELLKKSLT